MGRFKNSSGWIGTVDLVSLANNMSNIYALKFPSVL
jgi:hypothetical protein